MHRAVSETLLALGFILCIHTCCSQIITPCDIPSNAVELRPPSAYTVNDNGNYFCRDTNTYVFNCLNCNKCDSPAALFDKNPSTNYNTNTSLGRNPNFKLDYGTPILPLAVFVNFTYTYLSNRFTMMISSSDKTNGVDLSNTDTSWNNNDPNFLETFEVYYDGTWNFPANTRIVFSYRKRNSNYQLYYLANNPTRYNISSRYWQVKVLSRNYAFDPTELGFLVCPENTEQKINTTNCPICTPCVAGTVSTAGGQCVCNTGYFSPSGNTMCSLCPTGSFSASVNSTACTVCPTGSYNTAAGSSACTVCPAGSYVTGNSACTVCPAGSYNAVAGSSACTTCPAGSYNAVAGSSDCTVCPAGSYVTGSSACTVCPAGSYNAVAGSSTCTTCPQGAYSIGSGATACNLCAAGSASAVSGASTVCTAPRNLTWLFKDPANQFYYLNLPRVQNAAYHVGAYGQKNYGYSKVRIQSRLAANMTRIQLYVRHFDNPTSPCSSTKYDYKYGTGPTAVEFGGIFTSSKTASITLNLRNSSFGLFNGINSWSTACSTSVSSFVRNCLDPQYCTLSMYAATGYAHFTGVLSVLNAASFDSDVYTACVLNVSDPLLQCEGGEAWCPSPCTGCQPGYYASDAGATQCTPCPMGAFASQHRSLACTSCPVGTWSATTGTAICTPCAAGKYADSTGSTVCVSCPAGSVSSSSGTSVCALCPAGTFSPFPGATVCTACPLGKYTDTPGQTQCTPCSPGTFANKTGAGLCTACAVGAYAASSGSTICTRCAAGSLARFPGSTACQTCIPGTYNPTIGAQSCIMCPTGTASAQSGLTQPCPPCAPQTYADYIGQVTCVPCPVGQSAPNYGSSACVPCPAGSYYNTQDGGCTLCEAGTYADTSGNIDSCPGYCDVGYYLPNAGMTAPLPCPIGQYSDGFGAVTECYACPVDSYTDSPASSECMACPSGTTTQGLSGQSACS